MNLDVLRTKLRTGDPPAPGKLVLVEGFLNTCHNETDLEDFATAKSTEEWLRGVGLWTGSKKITSAQTQTIIEFRNCLRAMVLDKEQFQSLNELVDGIPFQAEFNPEGGVQFQATGDGGDRILGTLIGVISESLQNGTWDRFKCCSLPTCGWAYYDSTRSRTKRWCSMKTCGSRHKAREYYKRKQ